MKLLFSLWVLTIVLAGAVAGVRHHRVLREEGRAGEGPRSTLVHILVPGCPCSERVARALVGVPGEVRWVKGEEAERWRREQGVLGGPWLLAFDREGRRIYSGGYGREVDRAMLAELAAGRPVARRKSYGCAFAERSGQ